MDNNYNLYFQIYSINLALQINEYTSGFNGCLLTSKTIDNLNIPDKTYTNKFDYSEDVDESYSCIVVWLGTSNYIYQKSARIVSLKDLYLLASEIHLEDKPKKKKKVYYKGQFERKYKAGRVIRYNKHKNFKSVSKCNNTIIEYSKEYPQLLRKKNRFKFEESTHFYYSPLKQSGNGWKENTKKKKQYLKHIN